MPLVGNVQDFTDIEDARAKAAELAREIVETRANPNDTARKAAKAELTLRRAFQRYRGSLSTQVNSKASGESLRVHDRVVRKFDALGWLDRKVREIDPDEIVTKFLEGMSTPSANEQMYRWASTAVNTCLSDDIWGAKVKGLKVPEGANPFEVLTRRELYRSRATLNRVRQANGARTPLGPSTTLGTFLEAAWSKKDINDAATGVHYLVLMLLWGCRASEHAACRWGELLSEHGEPGAARANTSHVWLRDDGQYGPYVFFYNTKNGRDHRLPITPMALNLLRQRQKLAAEEVARRGFDLRSRPFVFPARSKFSSTGHYMDATDLLSRIREEAGIVRVTRHDLRRSFGSVMRGLSVDEGIKKRFFNHGTTDVTASYTEAEWALLRHEMERIEHAILVTAPNVYNALKPTEWPPLAAPDPHQCKPAKPRSGRPRKEVGPESDTA
jgi:integrase